MKKLFLAFAVILSGTVMILSCKKEAAVPRVNDQQAVGSTARMPGANFAFDENEECSQDGASCHSVPPIIIKPECLGAIADAEAGGSTTVGVVFTSDLLREVCAIMSLDLEVMLKSGNYYIKKNYESATVINYMVGSTYPVTAQNRTTAFQLHK